MNTLRLRVIRSAGSQREPMSIWLENAVIGRANLPVPALRGQRLPGKRIGVGIMGSARRAAGLRRPVSGRCAPGRAEETRLPVGPGPAAIRPFVRGLLGRSTEAIRQVRW